ncbi:hypothetical protein IFM89_007699 [Coptis chinensis]|uniref:J domain-containing protein n=1 Tax=Coptis chinensis TaxID=261450 RepID=A0A835ITU3_9MAGN|nr:hypothetical protein IFM89_007699 [Coptis chinensis]
MAPSGVLVHPLSASSLRPSNSYPSRRTKTRGRGFHLHHKSVKCKASTSSFSVTDFDLYDLLGIDSSSDQSQIKMAYRSLQKRCHPDIAGPTGHEMAIILNDVYSILSDPISRSAYDKEQAKMAEFRGYSGKPIYSTWYGSENEERAVFVDEVKCVGCLKCALLAQKTFAIESVYGRARVVAQWADPENKIQDAIQACPVDCISMVERANLAALEYLMSKQPRVGTKGMVDIKKFQSKLNLTRLEVSTQDTREFAFHTIRSIANWFYWQSPKGAEHGGNLINIAGKRTQYDTNKLRDAATAARQGFWEQSNVGRVYNDENNYDNDYYWTPSTPPNVPEPSPFESSNTDRNSTQSRHTTTTSTELPKLKDDVLEGVVIEKDSVPRNPFSLRYSFPMATAILAAAIVRLQGGERLIVGGYDAGVQQHVAGSLAIDIVDSLWLQSILAGLTWYLVGSASVELLRALSIRHKKMEKKSADK